MASSSPFCHCYSRWMKALVTFYEEAKKCPICRLSLSNHTIPYLLIFECRCVVKGIHFEPIHVHGKCSLHFTQAMYEANMICIVYPTRAKIDDIVTELGPIVFNGSDGEDFLMPDICINCGANIYADPLTCGKCKAVCYCSRHCGTVYAKEHKKNCF
jgi:hypothetical protein